jgi:anti-sigma regulatory factor (Ser/Thr protein kinase)
MGAHGGEHVSTLDKIRDQGKATRVSSLDLIGSASAVHWARRHTDAALTAWCLNDNAIANAELCVSELATNAIAAVDRLHRKTARSTPSGKAPQTGQITVTLVLEVPDRLRISVTDPSPEEVPEPGLPDPLAEGGRGLAVIEALSSDQGVDYLPDGKVVWCVLDLSGGAWRF